MDIGAKSAFFSPQVGAGIRWPISSDISTRLDISQGRDFLIALGFDRRLVFDEPRRTAKLAASSGPDLQPTGNAVTVTLSVDPVRYEYYFSDVQFDDLAEHWAKNELLRVAKLGVLDPVVASDGRQIMAPNAPLNLIDAAKMVTLVAYLPQILSGSASTINYSIVDVPGVPYFVDIQVRDKNGKTVRHLKNKERHLTGEYTVVWDGRTESLNVPPPGEYRILMTVTNRNDEVVGESTAVVSVREKRTIQFESSAKSTRFTDILPGYPYTKFVNEWVAFGNTTVMIRNPDQRIGATSPLFQPTQSVSRLSFIIAISNVLKRTNGESYVIADLSPYKDIQDLPLSIKNALGLYISELDYGGDDQRRLRPYEPITRAEAARIVNRLLSWQEKRFGIKITN